MSVRKKKNPSSARFSRARSAGLEPAAFSVRSQPFQQPLRPGGARQSPFSEPYSHFPFWGSPEPVKPERVSGKVSDSSKELFIPERRRSYLSQCSRGKASALLFRVGFLNLL